jgi:hypothetical protein
VVEIMTATKGQKSRTDVAKLIHLAGPVTNVLLAVFIVTQLILAVSTLGGVLNPWVCVLALIIDLGAAVLMTRPGPYPMPLHVCFTVVGAVIVSTALVCWQLPPTGWPGYASWPFGANSFLLLFMCLRWRIGYAWIGMGAMTIVTVVWTTTTGQGWTQAIGLIDGQAGNLLIGTLFAIGIERTARRIAEFNAARGRHEASQAAAEAITAERSKQIARLDADARPVLELIAGGTDFPQEQRAELLILEAALRDGIRAARLSIEPVIGRARDARRRGVELLLLDDSGEAAEEAEKPEEFIDWVAHQLDSAHEGKITARILPRNREALVSIVIENESGTSTLEFAQTPAD